MNLELWNKAGEIVNTLSLKEKIGQLNQEYFSLPNLQTGEALKELVRNGEVGALVLSGSATAGNDETSTIPTDFLCELQRIAVEESDSKIPLLFGRDVIHGHKVVLPIPLALSATFHPDIIKEGYRGIAQEAAKEGVHWTFTPMIDISRDARWGRCVEGIGEDPYLGEQVAKAVVEGLQGDTPADEDRLIACAKHYIGYGAAAGGRDYANAEMSDTTLRNYYLKPFRAAVKAGTGTVMSSFNEIDNMPATANRYLLREILREELGFDGFVVSDWGAVEQTVDQGIAADRKEAAKRCIEAGLDMDMVCRCYAENLEELVREGAVREETVDESARRIIYIKLLAGLFEHPYPPEYEADYEKHLQCAKQCADEAMILLKNKNDILPLDKNTKIFAAGPYLHEKRAMHGTWCLDGDVGYTESYYEVMREKCAALTVPDSAYLPDSGLYAVRKNEAIVLFLGESNESNGEARCVTNIDFPTEQLAFVKKMKRYGIPIIGVMTFGRPVALEEAEPYFDAILYTWQSGNATARSAVDILFGKVNPSGRVPMTFPRVTGQTPIYYNHPAGPRFVNGYYYENGVDGYNYIDTHAQPMYRFGYGLSYTAFAYGEVKTDKTVMTLQQLRSGEKFRIGVNVKNTGERAGKETSQLYMRDVCASISRPYRELKGISKNDFAVGEEKEVTFELGFEELAFYNAKGEFAAEPGAFEVYVGSDCYADKKAVIEITE